MSGRVRVGAAECRREWARLREEWGPGREHGWIGSSLGELIAAAVDEPVLLRLFPYTSMNELHVSQSGDFRQYGGEGFPGVVGWEGGYHVVEGAGGDRRTVLSTPDPARALACFVELVERRLVERRPAERRAP
ncbi:DUF6193 family natural product biosynthesis protein [Kitasatospora sp. NPDC001540]|uniref:DUF6193 family natural product biosynthesis protein n=1 Tax=Kitasatospora sp. NPDC001540 TaxID=3364014 RepID=UPI0036A02FCF